MQAANRRPMPLSLRPYQSDTIANLRAALQRHRSALCVLPTGGGKTVLAAYMLGTARERGKSAWFVAHRDFLLDQTAGTFDNVGIPYGFIAAGRPFNPHHAVQIVSIGTAARRLDRLQPPDIIVWDEAHHIAAAGYRAIYKWANKSRHVGLSATPARLDGKGLDEFFDELVSGPTVSQLMADGYLSNYRAFAPSAPNLSGVHTIAGDYNRGELGTVMDDGQIIGDMVRHYRERADGCRAIYFAVGVDHSRHIAGTFTASGIPAKHLDGNSTTSERREAAIELANGTIKVLSNVDICGEGFDLSSQANCEVPIECVGLARPTKSLALHLQQIGRALRPKEAPAIILDHAGNCLTLGLPDDRREWSLRGVDRKKAAASAGPAVTQCASCYGVHRAGLMACPYCGTAREMKAREVEEVAGELVEVENPEVYAHLTTFKQLCEFGFKWKKGNPNHHPSNRHTHWANLILKLRETSPRFQDKRNKEKAEQAAAKTTADLIQIARRRGYKNPGFWAINVMKGRAKYG